MNAMPKSQSKSKSTGQKVMNACSIIFVVLVLASIGWKWWREYHARVRLTLQSEDGKLTVTVYECLRLPWDSEKRDRFLRVVETSGTKRWPDMRLMYTEDDDFTQPDVLSTVVGLIVDPKAKRPIALRSNSK